MALPYDSAPKFQDYARPEMLVTTEWVAEHLEDPGLVVAESDEDVLLYETGHIPGAVKLDWHTELNDPVTRDYVDGAGFARLMSEKGITRDTTLVVYGDKNNWWAAYALWVCTLFEHPDLRLVDGGRAKWIAEGRPATTDVPRRPQTQYPVIGRDDAVIRAFRDQVAAHLGKPMIDVRSPGEYTGELLHMPDYPQEGALRGGHTPPPATPPSAPAESSRRSTRTRPECGRRTTSWCTAGSESGPATPGSCSTTCWAIRGCATTTGHGPSGGTPSGSPSPEARVRDDRHAQSPPAGDRRGLRRRPRHGAAAAAAGVLAGPAVLARPVRRAPRPARAGAGVPGAALPGCRCG